MQTVKGVKVRCIKLLKNKVYKFARYISTLPVLNAHFLEEKLAHIGNKPYLYAQDEHL